MSLLRSLLLVVVLFAFYSMACQGSQPPRRAVANPNGVVANQNPGNGQQGNNGIKMPTEEEKKQQEFMDRFNKISADLDDRLQNQGKALDKAELKKIYKMEPEDIKDFKARLNKLPQKDQDKLLNNAKWTPDA